MNARETAGKIYTDLKAKKQDKVDIFEYVRTTKESFMPDLVNQVENDKLKTDNDFYVEVCFRRPFLMPELEETYIKSRHTCPTPFPDRAVFRYDKREDRIIFLWHVPSLQEVQYYIDNALMLRKDELEAAKDVFDYKDGTLLRLAKTLNGEINDYELIFHRKDTNGQPTS